MLKATIGLYEEEEDINRLKLNYHLILSSSLRFISFGYIKSLIPPGMDEEVILQKSEKKKHKRIKEKEALSSSEVPIEEKKKHKKSKEKETLSSSEVSTDMGGAQKVKGSEEKKVVSDNGKEGSGKRKKKKDQEKEKVTKCSDVECSTDQAAFKGKDHIDVSGAVEKDKGTKNKRKNTTGGDSGESYIEKSGGEAQSGSRSSKKRNREGKEDLSSSEVPTEKKNHKRNKEREALSSSEVSTDVGGAKKVKGSEKKEGVPDNGKEKSGKRKNKKDKEMVMECSDVECATDQAASKWKDHIGVNKKENNEHLKTGKGKMNENGGDSGESYIEKSGGVAQSGSRSSKKRNREEEVLDVAIGEGKEKKKKRAKLDANTENMKANVGDVDIENNFGSNVHLRNSDSKNSSKRVKFASHVAVFPSSDGQDDRQENLRNKLVQGKRFTRQEDQIIKDAVHNYIEAHKLGAKGLDMILHCKKYPMIRNCWKEIGAALPYRPYEAVYQRGHTLFERADSCKWTEDEKAFVLKFYEKHGPDWKGLGQALGKHRHHVRDTWRRIFRAGLKTGNWDQSEYQSLFNLVNKDLRMRMYEERASKHGLIRDNISWQAISNRLATRTQMKCCIKWYDQLSSSMVKEGKWADTDDYRLLDELFRLDACCIEDVDWDNLLKHRPGDITLKRWRQMVNHIGIHGLQSFAGKVEVLAKRYCPELLEVREVLDSRPVVD
ncbi:hypothetical protein MKW98_018918 [Papaver atlanticum]|uniref:Myb-like domain-containing protein n=1 Tax=Papaver atlanticum TaxID=357466 RepID=A0AAD4TJ11_9MAGN|nr:hypothetical protein MKW98_018918 [Papaver atlanticum]